MKKTSQLFLMCFFFQVSTFAQIPELGAGKPKGGSGTSGGGTDLFYKLEKSYELTKDVVSFLKEKGDGNSFSVHLETMAKTLQSPVKEILFVAPQTSVRVRDDNGDWIPKNAKTDNYPKAPILVSVSVNEDFAEFGQYVFLLLHELGHQSQLGYPYSNDSECDHFASDIIAAAKKGSPDLRLRLEEKTRIESENQKESEPRSRPLDLIVSNTNSSVTVTGILTNGAPLRLHFSGSKFEMYSLRARFEAVLENARNSRSYVNINFNAKDRRDSLKVGAMMEYQTVKLVGKFPPWGIYVSGSLNPEGLRASDGTILNNPKELPFRLAGMIPVAADKYETDFKKVSLERPQSAAEFACIAKQKSEIESGLVKMAEFLSDPFWDGSLLKRKFRFEKLILQFVKLKNGTSRNDFFAEKMHEVSFLHGSLVDNLPKPWKKEEKQAWAEAHYHSSFEKSTAGLTVYQTALNVRTFYSDDECRVASADEIALAPLTLFVWGPYAGLLEDIKGTKTAGYSKTIQTLFLGYAKARAEFFSFQQDQKNIDDHIILNQFVFGVNLTNGESGIASISDSLLSDLNFELSKNESSKTLVQLNVSFSGDSGSAISLDQAAGWFKQRIFDPYSKISQIR